MYPLKLKTSKQALHTITSTFSTFPFATRDLFALDAKYKLGFNECTDSGVLVGLPVVESLEKDALVAQFKFTMLLTQNGPIVLT